MRRKIAVNVYKGLVPISPKTSPIDLTIPGIAKKLLSIPSIPVIRNNV
jgi:hypothetical protein